MRALLYCLACLLAAALLCATAGCASSRQGSKQPRFTAPPVSPVREAITTTQRKIVSAQVQAKNVNTSIRRAQGIVAGLSQFPAPAPSPALLGELRLELTSAGAATDLLTQALLDASAGAEQSVERAAVLETKVVEQTGRLNDFAAQTNDLLAERPKILAASDRWRGKVMRYRLWAAGLTAALGIYIFKGPILFGARKLLGLPF